MGCLLSSRPRPLPEAQALHALALRECSSAMHAVEALSLDVSQAMLHAFADKTWSMFGN